MRELGKYVKKYTGRISLGVFLKLLAAGAELLIPYVLEYLIDEVAPRENVTEIILYGLIMVVLAFAVRETNVRGNRIGAGVSKDCTYEIRRDLFEKSMSLSGKQTDEVGLPSLISRMTSDSYNIQNFLRAAQAMGIRAPMLLLGGIIVTFTMDTGLALILAIMAPVLIALVVFVSFKGIPLYKKVQSKVDDIVRVMRENITGIRVVKALSKEDYERNRYRRVNNDLTKTDIIASIVMSLPGPMMQLFLNGGLTLVVYVGAIRVNAGVTKPGVILAFLTYFNMVLMGVMGLNRIFMMMSRANASAARIFSIINLPEDLVTIPESEGAKTDRKGYIVFDHVDYSYNKLEEGDKDELSGEDRQKTLYDIDFEIKKGGSLGIIGATGAGKTTIFNLLMRFYDADKGHVFVDGKDVRTYDKKKLHSMFGSVFQNDVLLTGNIKDNIIFGREADDETVMNAAEDARAAVFISKYDDDFDHEVTKLGSNLSGGQKQRVMISRALAGDPDILLLDDSSSALDYKTDSEVRKAIREKHAGTTLLVVAQRISSIMSLDEILVLDEGHIIGRGTHKELLASCKEYKEIYETQMGDE